MRIDDENKVVWCSYELLDWYKSFGSRTNNSLEYRVKKLSDFGWGVNLLNGQDREVNISYGYLQGDKESKLPLIKALCDDYEFKLEQPQKYYWRKKKEHLARFEKGNIYLSATNEPYLNPKLFARKFTETEARDLLKDDFDKFEKVECE